MTFLQNLWRDLVDKHLWPVAVALLLVLVAIPFIVDTGSAARTAPAAAVAPAGAVPPATAAQIAVAAAPGAAQVRRTGRSRDPFKPLVYAKVPKAATAATAGPTAATTKAPGGTSGAGSTSVGGGSPTTGTGSKSPPAAGTTTPSTSTAPTTTTTKTRLYSYAISVVLKRAGRTTTRHGLHAITYLPSAVYPFVTFLGVKADGETATFLLADNVGVIGAGSHCLPATTRCSLVELKAGENVLLERKPKFAEPIKRFRLILRRVALREVEVKPKAAATHKRATTRATTVPGPELPADLAPARQVTLRRSTH